MVRQKIKSGLRKLSRGGAEGNQAFVKDMEA